MQRQEYTSRDFVARLAASRPKKLTPLAKKLVRSTGSKFTYSARYSNTHDQTRESLDRGRKIHVCQGDPRRWNNFSLDLHTEISVLVVNSTEGIKNQRLPIEQTAAIYVCFVPSTRIFLTKAVYMVLGPSYLSNTKNLSLERSYDSAEYKNLPSNATCGKLK